MKNNKYCLPIPDAFSLTVQAQLLVAGDFQLFDGNGLNFDLDNGFYKDPVKGSTFFGSLDPASIKAFTKNFPIKLSAIQIEFQDKFTAPSPLPQRIPEIRVQKANIDGLQFVDSLSVESLRRNTQFQANTIMIPTPDLVIDGNTAITFSLDRANALLFTFFIDEILNC